MADDTRPTRRTRPGPKPKGMEITEPTSGADIVAALDEEKAKTRAARAPSARLLAGRGSNAETKQMIQQNLGHVEAEAKPRGLSRVRSLRQAVADQPENQLPTALQSEETFYAIKYVMGQRYYYNLVTPIGTIAAVLPRPDPERPTPGNRRVKLTHAKDCAGYVRANPYYAMPALIIRGPDKFGWQQLTEPVNGVSLGLLRIPKSVRLDLGILDGQHRILGFNLALEDLTHEMQVTQSKITQANAKGDAEVLEELALEFDLLTEQRERLLSESIATQIMVENEDHAYRQAFADIADNAMGITSAVRARFDTRKVANRALEEVLHHDLLKDHVEMDADRVVGESQNWVSAKHVADLIRILEVGNSGRMGKGREEEMDEGHLVEQTDTFFDILITAFPVLEQLSDNTITAKELRSNSLLGSATMLRVLAGVYHRLRAHWDSEEFVDAFGAIADTMTAPISETSDWVGLPGIEVGAKAPSARRQDIEALVSALVTLWVGEDMAEESEEGESAA